MKRKLRTAAALVLTASMVMGSTAVASAANFSDVPTGHWAYSFVDKASRAGLVKGVGGSTYGVNDKLSAAQFSVMLCNLLYPNSLSQYQSSGKDWWFPYMELAYEKGILAGTEAVASKSTIGAWSPAEVNADMSRCDLAQVIFNVSRAQGWAEPSQEAMLIAMLSISDQSSIPAQYQAAVFFCYAKGYLSGLDNKGTFGGNTSMSRGQAAVVLCSLLDAKSKVDTPSYTNRGNRLVNGSEANEESVARAIQDLKSDFGEYSVWDIDRSYTSPKLSPSNVNGSQGFAYMLSDKVFGAMSVSQQKDPSRLKVGDVVYLRSKGVYGLVHSVDGDDFEYVYCDNSSYGMVSWKGKGDIDDLGSSDTIYSRYEGKNKDALANGEKATVTNVNKLLDKLDDDKKFKDGATWRNKDEYESDVLGDAKGTEAFAYKLSDEIFGDLPYRTHDDHDEMLPGDILYMDEDEVYVVILSVDTKKEEFTYVWADDYYQEIDWNCKGSYEDFTRYDKVYTRYPEDLKSEDKKDENKKDDTLTNGKAITEKNVEALLADLWKKHEGEDWEDESWTSKAFTSKKVYADQAFAYYISDKIFGDSLKVSELTRVSKLQAGDVIKLGREYIVVYEVDQDEETFRYLYLDDYYEVEISSTSSNSSRWTDLDEIDTKTDTIYTRYPS